LDEVGDMPLLMQSKAPPGFPAMEGADMPALDRAAPAAR